MFNNTRLFVLFGYEVVLSHSPSTSILYHILIYMNYVYV